MNEASGMPTLRTDALQHGSTFTYPHRARELCYELERELAAMELRAMDCVALNERQAINFAKCQSELQQARTMHAEAIEEWAKWEGAAKQAREEALDAAEARFSGPFDGTEGLDSFTLAWAINCLRALKPSPASGEQTNAAGQASGQPHFTRGQENKPAPAAPNAAPQMSAAATLPVTPAVEAGQPAAAVPDDPMMVLLSLTPKSDTGILRFPEWHDAIRALAAHYEAKGMRMAAEICKSVSAAESERTIGRPTSGEYQIGAEFCAAAILAAATKQEADRGRR